MNILMDSLEEISQTGSMELLGWLGAGFIAGAAIGILAALLYKRATGGRMTDDAAQERLPYKIGRSK